MSSDVMSPEYLEQQRKLHDKGAYGISGQRYADQVVQLAMVAGATDSILDYGCGQQTLQEAIPQFKIDGYDPSLEGLDAKPEPHKLVVCTDVLEHIEPDYLDTVLNDLKRVTERVLFLAIHKGPAKKVLEDGRNAHLIQQDIEYWLPKLWSRFHIDTAINQPDQLLVTCSVRVEQ
jgi:hypothetical protein